MKYIECLTVKEIAAVLKVNPITIYDYIRLRKLPAVKIGRYYRVFAQDFEHFLTKQKVS